MTSWVVASLVFFGYVLLVVPFVAGLPRRRRALATGGSLSGFVLAGASHLQPSTTMLHDWLLPPALLLLAYWSSGLLFARPMPPAERVLDSIDRALSIDRLAAATPQWLAELLELSYFGVYPLIPLALLISLVATPGADAERFWTVILVTDFVCFGFLPWVQTRPPRALRSADPWISRMRRFNLRLLGTTSIQVNTFPSGHAAEALALTLLVAGAPWPWVVCIAVAGVLVSVGAVFGRYHYAADALSGWMVAVVVWWAI